MDTGSGQHRIRTLGEWLAGLRPGDGCPCCGARLVVAAPVGAARKAAAFVTAAAYTNQAAAASGSSADAHALLCPVCGCELDDEAPLATGTCRALSTAA